MKSRIQKSGAFDFLAVMVLKRLQNDFKTNGICFLTWLLEILSKELDNITRMEQDRKFVKKCCNIVQQATTI